MDTASAIAATMFVVVMISVAIMIAREARKPSGSTETR